jgi:hypothetical protein
MKKANCVMPALVVKYLGEIMFRSLALASLLSFATVASVGASTLSGDFGGTIAIPTGATSSTFVHQGGGGNTLTWGAPSGGVQQVQQGNASTLSVDNNAFSHSLSGAGEFLLGTISWENQSNWHHGGTWNSVMTLELSFNAPSGTITRDLLLDISVVNTTDLTDNTDLNEATGSAASADRLTGRVVRNGLSANPIDLGQGYRLDSVLFRLVSTGAPGTEASFFNNGSASGSRFDPATGLWENREGGVSQIGLFASVSTERLESISAVPLPAGLWLLLAGLGSLVLSKRRKPQIG